MIGTFRQAGLVSLALVGMFGCATTGQQHRADVYRAGQVNQAQDAKVIRILAVLPAQVEVDNVEGRRNAQLIGAVVGGLGGVAATRNSRRVGTGTGMVGGAAAGAAAGSLVSSKVLVEGVSLTYVYQGRTLNSAQVGRQCEFMPGDAVMISTSPTETRIQPNNQCPPEKRG